MKESIAFVKELYQRIMENDLFGKAAQLAYFFLLSLFPFMLFLMTLVGFLPIDDQTIIDFIERYAPGEITELINQNVTDLVNERNGQLLSIGIIGTLWSASNAINAIIQGFNEAYEVDEDRSFIVSRLIAIVLTIAMFFVIIMAFLLPIFGKTVGEYIFSFFGLSAGFLDVWEMLRWVVSSVVFFIVLLALYKLAPNKRIYFRNAVWGALFATIGWQLVSLAFSFYVNSIGNYSATYGSLGTVIILMIWFYLSGVIIMIGGMINALVRKRTILEIEE
ncbi:YihY/virulence factor BrkB family protein [Virgibacillus doumboii]|uniref:YihY/virulence factor BrkB family protein n=1 Tax=Virgibacillus doumboii TaxID=2697503 RepID=UPI0013DF7078|nr:YihY/virulence factor BrkB family protein [Virgibacillus doumboii]